MKVPAQNLQVDTTKKTTQLEGFKGGSRKFLRDLAVDLIMDDGTIKSGYLKLKTSGSEASIESNHIGSGATVATKLVKKLVKEAYGESAAQILDEYLRDKGKDKIGTLSFVKLIQVMESKSPDAPERLAEAKGYESGSLYSENLLSMHTLQERAMKSLYYQSLGARIYLENFSPIADWKQSLEQANNHFEELNFTIDQIEKLGIEDTEVDTYLYQGIVLRGQILKVIEQLTPQPDQSDGLNAPTKAD